jgi:hypothetical protein
MCGRVRLSLHGKPKLVPASINLRLSGKGPKRLADI